MTVCLGSLDEERHFQIHSFLSSREHLLRGSAANTRELFGELQHEDGRENRSKNVRDCVKTNHSHRNQISLK